MSARYYFINRPPMYATLPDGYEKYEQWMPGRTVEGASARHFLGYADYPQKLTFHEIWKWELEPADRKEAIEFEFYKDEDRNEQKAVDNLRDWLTVPDEILEKEKRFDYRAVLTLEYKRLLKGEAK